MHTSLSLHFIDVQCLDIFRALLAHPQVASNARKMSRHWTSIKCSESEVCIKLVVLLRNYVTMMHGQQNIKFQPWISIIKSVEQLHTFTLYFMRSLCYEGWTDNKFTWRIIPGLKNRPDCGYVRGLRPRVIVICFQPPPPPLSKKRSVLSYFER
jgi:hypothetical protein